jgi:NADPH:quinone reductase-like Zn-dependent oxidoreductase
MKAAVYTEYGPPDVVQLREMEKPAPKPDEVLIETRAASVNAYDLHYLRADPFFIRLMGGGLLKPSNQRLGADIAGRIEAVGTDVKQFQPGDEVYGDLARWGNGSFAEYVCASEDAVALKPANITFEAAAAVPMAGITALQALRDFGHIQPGHRVLIHGASGGVGTFAVQIAKAFGAEVTAVCSPRHLDMVRRIGADQVVDYTKEDFSRRGQRYDLILAANGNRSIRDYRRALSSKGILVVAGGSMAQLFQAILLGPRMSRAGGQTIGTVTGTPHKGDYGFLNGLLEAGKVVPVIDRCYPLGEIAEALRYVGEGHARGKVVVVMESKDRTQSNCPST